MSRIYWDSMLFVYFIEDHPQYKMRVKSILATMHRRQDTLCASVFTVGEVLTGPYKRGASAIVAQVKEAFRSPEVELLAFTFETSERYARIRAENRVSPADAIHLATAAQAGVNLFLTNDRTLPNLRSPDLAQ